MSLLLATAYKAHDHYTRSQGYSARSSVPQDLQTRLDVRSRNSSQTVSSQLSLYVQASIPLMANAGSYELLNRPRNQSRVSGPGDSFPSKFDAS
jgi:hypothetical protein